MTLAAWLHDLDPFVFRISGEFGIRWYGLSYAAGFVIAYYLLRWMCRRGMTVIPEDRAGDVIIIGALAGVIGGRLGYVLAYQPSLLWDVRPSFPWWGLLDLMHGGMASHGGFIGAAVAAWRVSRGFKETGGAVVGRAPMLHVMDVMALITPTGLLLGRIANFINGELLGAIVAAPGARAPWWSVKFPQELLDDRRPVLTPEQEASLAGLVRDFAPGDGMGGLHRLVEGVQRGAPGLAERLEPLISARFPSQLFQALAEGLVLGAAIWMVARRPRLPGVITACFLMFYGVLRIVTEVWRLPDAQFAVGRPLGLSRGQWFSLAMVALGAALLWRVASAGGQKMGGWGRRENKPA
jgi:phosphatidylglycerol:prolipoprotein diacylglycerol transferase